MTSLWLDVRYGMRMLFKNPGFTILGILTLALGIGVNTAIFTMVNAVLLKSLPYANADELTGAYLVSMKGGDEAKYPFPPALYLNLRSRTNAFTDVAALSNKGWAANLTDAGEPERLQGFQVSDNLFSVLGVKPELGRSFLAEEDRPGTNRVVVISHDLWQRRFASDRNVLGRRITLNGESYAVVGVMPADFRFYSKTDVWTPLAFSVDEQNENHSNYLELIARRKPGVTPEQAAADTTRVVTAFINDPKSDIEPRLVPPQTLLTSEVRPMLLLLLSAVGFVLLISCVNMANLTLARGTVRRRELAVRVALGARRSRIVRQLLLESALLALLGGAGGLLFAQWALKFLIAGLPEYLADANSHVASVHVDTTALAFTLGVSVLATILFGFVPALQLSRIDLNRELKDGARTVGTRSRFRSALVVTEITLAMVTLVGAGLMIKSLWRLVHVNLGYQPEKVLAAQIDPSGSRFEKDEQVDAFYNELLPRITAIPGVKHAGFINSLNASTDYSVDEHPNEPPDRRHSAQMNQVSPDYFAALAIPLRTGRFFNEHDIRSAPRVIVIDESLAQAVFPGEQPVGKHLNFWKNSWEIVGIAGGARYWEVNKDPVPHIYFSYHQVNWHSMTLVVQTDAGDPMRLVGPIRAQVAAVDKDQPIHTFKLYEAIVSDLVAPWRFTTFLLAAFAALAALLSAIGIYGVMSYSVTQSTRDIGVRMALGARSGNVLRLVVGKGMVLAVIGVALGLAGSYALTRYISTLLFEVKPTDAMTFSLVALGLLLVALIACYIPARRATKVDPLVALRYE
ncbi:MAG TPA: ABC transporter permease [Pyrinomonadaceae bacterium]|nr:ABC transporter permease [Pyrinomonadaceae bacterium]